MSGTPAAMWRLAVLLAAVAMLFLLSLTSGHGGVQPAEAFNALGDPEQTLHAVIIELRLPRALSAFGCGALLALSGALLQALLRNPLADPFVLGISSGAGACTLGALMLGAGSALTLIAGIAGAGLSIALLLLLAWRGGLLPTRLLLAGVMLSALWGAVLTLLLALAPDAPLRGMLHWLMGDLAATSLGQASAITLGAALALVAVWPLAGALDALSRGELGAAALGVPIQATRLWVFGVAALAAAGVVLLAGGIGFVGLVVPHLIRLAGLRGHRQQLPACALGGAALLLAADLLARQVAAPLQLPVGALTALIGAPMFLFLLTRTAQTR